MQSLYEFLQRIGMESLDTIWFPLLIWTVVATVIFGIFRLFERLNPLYHYHLRVATLAAIPFGLLATFGVNFLGSQSASQGTFDPAVFIVETPETFAITESTAEVFQPNWIEPNFLLGTLTLFLLVVSVIMLIRLGASYVSLKRLHTSLSSFSLNQLSGFSEHPFNNVQIAFHTHPLVPFTFGWNSPIIVLPKSIQDDPEKVRMAVQHELVHIKRGDYLLQLFLSVIENLFWFHPLIKLGAREIETYREISCDQEVLNTSGISLKKYASMLYELLPLNRGLGSFSVSMAVQQSTLKKRIMTMKYHSMYKTSIRRSVFFLFVMILGVTLPIACSDLRGPEAVSARELSNTILEMDGITVEINGKQVLKQNKGVGASSTGLSALLINTGEYGIFKISPMRFDGGKLSGQITGNKANFSINELNVHITSEKSFLNDIVEADIWVQHYAGKARFSHAIIPASRSLEDFLSEMTSGSVSQEANEDYFVVVEEMPKLIGGLASVQSKVVYPEMAKRAGIEGRVTLQFIVNENGDVENPQVISGIGGGCDEAALEAVSQAKFEPGIQRGRPVRVQYSLPVVFRLSDSDFTDGDVKDALKEMKIDILEKGTDFIRIKVTDNGTPLAGASATIRGTDKGAATNMEGIATIRNVPSGVHYVDIKYIGYQVATYRGELSRN